MPSRDTNIIRKQSNVQFVIKQGYPVAGDAKEGTLTVRYIPGTGLCIFVFYANRWKMTKLNDLNSKDETILENLVVNNITINNDITFNKPRKRIPGPSPIISDSIPSRNPDRNIGKGEKAYRNLRDGIFNPEFGDTLSIDGIKLRNNLGILNVRNADDSADGDIRVANVKDVNNNKSIEITATADAVNHLKVLNGIAGTANAVFMTVDGETNASVGIQSKGNGSIVLAESSTSTAIKFKAISGAVPIEINPTGLSMLFTNTDGDVATLGEEADGEFRIWTNGLNTAQDLTVSAANDLGLYTGSGAINFYKTNGNAGGFDTGTGFGSINLATSSTLKLLSTSGYAVYISAEGNGALSLLTQGTGDVSLASAAGDVNITAGDDITLTATGDIALIANNGSVDIGGDGDIWLAFDNLDATESCRANFGKTNVGFTQQTVTENGTDTYVYFNLYSNKQHLTVTDNITDVHFRFPVTSGNFVCVILQDGAGNTVSNWKAMDNGGSSATLKWAGVTAPSNTELDGRADIASFYWDATNSIAYGTYTYNF